MHLFENTEDKNCLGFQHINYYDYIKWIFYLLHIQCSRACIWIIFGMEALKITQKIIITSFESEKDLRIFSCFLSRKWEDNNEHFGIKSSNSSYVCCIVTRNIIFNQAFSSPQFSKRLNFYIENRSRYLLYEFNTCLKVSIPFLVEIVKLYQSAKNIEFNIQLGDKRHNLIVSRILCTIILMMNQLFNCTI